MEVFSIDSLVWKVCHERFHCILNIVFLWIGYSQEKLAKLKVDLEQAGYSSFETSIGTSGVTQHLITTDVSHDP